MDKFEHLKNRIEKEILLFIYNIEPGMVLSQSDISRGTGLSKPTIGKYLPLLLLRGELNEYVNTQRLGNAVVFIRK